MHLGMHMINIYIYIYIENFLDKRKTEVLLRQALLHADFVEPTK